MYPIAKKTIVLLLTFFLLVGCTQSETSNETSAVSQTTDTPYTILNDNHAEFSDREMVTQSYETYSPLDHLGRCGQAMACVGKDIMPTEERGAIGQVKPSGWHTVKYDNIDGKYLYNRCHLIAYQLTGENANENNLITGTRFMNQEGMLPFENRIADYVNQTGYHVLYRVTPLFENNNLVASGVEMEAKSVEDNGKGLEFHVFCPNVQPGIEINYQNGESQALESNDSSNDVKPTESQPITSREGSEEYILNRNTMVFHRSNCSSVKRIKKENQEAFIGNRKTVIAQGYQPCGSCKP